MSRSDREMLELAAKAAGMWGDFELDDHDTPIFDEREGFRLAWGLGWWNPLADDGDEARLEAVLGLDVTWDHEKQIVVVGTPSATCWEPYGYDKQAARRLAGVRAAAETGASNE